MTMSHGLRSMASTATRVGAQAVWMHQAAAGGSGIPGFADGDVSVQDAGAQFAAPWLGVQARHARARRLRGAGWQDSASGSSLARHDLTAVEVDSARASALTTTFVGPA